MECRSQTSDSLVDCHRAAAAFLAAAFRCNGVIPAALAFPPFAPPFRPSATAAGSLPASGSGVFGACPVASSMIRCASTLASSRSFGTFLGDFAIP